MARAAPGRKPDVADLAVEAPGVSEMKSHCRSGRDQVPAMCPNFAGPFWWTNRMRIGRPGSVSPRRFTRPYLAAGFGLRPSSSVGSFAPVGKTNGSSPVTDQYSRGGPTG